MKQINFIETPSPKDRELMHRWFWISTVLLLVTIITLIAISVQQSSQLQTLLKEQQSLATTTATLDACLIEKRALKQKEETLKKQIAKSTHIKENPKNPEAIIQTLSSTLPQAIELSIINIKKKKLNITLIGSTTQEVLSYTDTLKKQKLFAHVSLQSIEPSEKRVKATLEIELT